MDERNDRATIALAGFRIFLGALVTLSPFFVGEGLDPYGMTVVATGVALIAAAPLMHRAPWLRWVQAALALELFFMPFAFGEAVSDREIYSAVLLGHGLLLSAIVSPRLFRQDEDWSPATSASELVRSSASNTSSVSTPPN
jgi:hypothetical protein